MSKAILIKNRVLLNFILACVFFACSHVIQKSDLTLSSTKYYEKIRNSLYTGVAISRYLTGEVESRIVLQEGIVKSVSTYGYEGELIVQSVYKQTDLINKNIERLLFVESIEGSEYHYYSVVAIVKSQDVDFNMVEKEILEADFFQPYFERIREVEVAFKIKTGELESSIYENSLAFDDLDSASMSK